MAALAAITLALVAKSTDCSAVIATLAAVILARSLPISTLAESTRALADDTFARSLSISTLAAVRPASRLVSAGPTPIERVSRISPICTLAAVMLPRRWSISTLAAIKRLLITATLEVN